MCPFMQFIDGGRRFQCVFCKSATEVPEEYFAYLDHMGDRTDKYQRPELCLGSYEFIATKDYCKNGQFPNPPAFIFMIDVSYNSIRNGMVKLLCENMKKILMNLPRENGVDKSKMKVGFVTYSNVVHFYNVKVGNYFIM
ncbi:protein transport protein Sec24C-like [Centruroides sculpturatus]|uniref:protein transport protein Sec24C-like n=1 Tax=Centruroides sculpturatus TaxID=218467 RepID=UPI000C6DD0B4|nr:protein transport protein Sec24C-like [Centruroides sculpturatus]